jgi:hypothetical protein
MAGAQVSGDVWYADLSESGHWLPCADLAALLAAEDTTDTNGLRAQVAAARPIGVILMLQSRFYEHPVADEPAGLASRRFAQEVNTAFGLLKAGIGDRYCGDRYCKEET